VLLACDDFGELSLTINGGRHGSNFWPWLQQLQFGM
jgi:hypothetical protein